MTRRSALPIVIVASLFFAVPLAFHRPVSLAIWAGATLLLVGAAILLGRRAEPVRPPATGAPPPQPARISHHPDFQAFIDATGDPMLIVDQGRVTNANRAAQRLFGTALLGENVRIAIRHAGAIDRIENPDVAAEGEPIRLTGIGQRDQVWDLRVRRIGSGQKLVLLNDRTAGAAAERMRVDFVANASHELMTPLASVKGFIETLGDPDAGGDEAVRGRFLAIMADETERMQALIRDLISLSRVEAEKYQPVEKPVDLALIAEDAVAVLRDGSNARGRDIVFDRDAEVPAVLGDATQLTQMVNNIVANAMKYGRPRTPILVTLGTSRSGTMVRLSVRDEGDGIAPEHLPRLTERFHRVDSGRSRAMGGTGLGLSLVKHIVDRHRGHFDIGSTVGQGTEVTVLLPVAPDTAE